jgi:dTDP-glucose pyrophosphorylase
MKKLANFKDYLTDPEFRLQDVIIRFNDADHQFLLVVDKQRRLLGTVTDGDLRRGILEGLSLEDSVSTCMFRAPTMGLTSDIASHGGLLEGLPFLPLINEQDEVTGILLPEVHPYGVSEAVIMAGGLGTRFGKVTRSTPKPLLAVAGKPMLEHIIANLEMAGVGHIWLSVNHLAEQFEDFLANRESQAEIRLLCEDDRLGTAGALSLLPEPPTQPILVLNGDVLTKIDYVSLDAFHQRHDYDAIIAAANHQVKVPYGVIRHDESGLFLGIDEKPLLRNYVAAGIYYLSPEIVALVPRNTAMDMPDVLNEARRLGMKIGLFPIHEYWADVAGPKDLEAAEVYHRDAG